MNQVAARNQVSYEVYVKDRSGRWQIHGHFTGTQKKQAEEEAKQIERANHVTGVKVIREVYNHETNNSDEYVVYETRGQGKLENAAIEAAANKRKRPVTKAAPQANRSAPSPAPSFDSKSDDSNSDSEDKVDAKAAIAAARRTAAADEGQSIVGLALKLMIAFCMAIAIGLATMLLSAKGLEYLPGMGMNISQGFYDKANFISFTVGFLASVVPMLMTLTKKFKGRAPRRPRAARQASGKSSRAPQARAGRNIAGSDATRKSAAEMAKELANDVDGVEESPSSAEHATVEENSTSDDGGDDRPSKPLVETRDMRDTRDQMKAFISGSMDAIQRTVPTLDAYHKFGVNLYVAGACDACSEKHALDQKDGRNILRDCISALGANKSMADTFCKNVDDYILEPKYKDMYGAGRKSMDAYIKDEKSITTSVSRAIADWSEKPAAGPQAGAGKKLHALMFTDIVNSTAKTQELGDHGAQQMVHIHNQIVRTALINNYGKEVKHMGDGIMAVFPSSASSVEAAIEIQKNMATHNSSQDMKFQIRIGINAGEAIAEENDLFGSVVQLAARVCAQAGGDETLVSENVKNTYSGSRAKFISQGTRQMKGFSDPIEVFQVQSRT